MAAVLLDTTVLIDFLRGRPGTHRRVRALADTGDSLFTSAVNVEETVRGLRPTEQEAAARLFAALRVVPLRETEGWQAGEWRRQFASQGQTVSQADCLVAAAAFTVHARVATGNAKDFPFAEVTVEHWPTGE